MAELRPFVSEQIVFEGIRGESFEGDIAIDDVSITLGKCKQESSVASADKTGKSLYGLCEATFRSQVQV